MSSDKPSDTTLIVCFWLGLLGWPWGFLIAAIIGGTAGVLRALKGMIVCWFVIIMSIIAVMVGGVLLAGAG
jgi:hypothetical protein